MLFNDWHDKHSYLGIVLWGNIMDHIADKKTTSPVFTFVLFVLGVGGIMGYVITKKKE